MLCLVFYKFVLNERRSTSKKLNRGVPSTLFRHLQALLEETSPSTSESEDEAFLEKLEELKPDAAVSEENRIAPAVLKIGASVKVCVTAACPAAWQITACALVTALRGSVPAHLECWGDFGCSSWQVWGIFAAAVSRGAHGLC